ncbi:LytR/AlgR family response regulator transcription factor [Alkalibacter mobilis]|uniref:LytR/AlgR family response regulator transcription factor n=1 Tax=Alkalibacter mobilis TaxID=2787712 RepID=UPI00189DA27E|nr:LytTR family DNA-binding domain-containing protein [Alkalibacter mobilis]MBF7096262.1 response regulator transcription factor [Alkalibacter mobilis]
MTLKALIVDDEYPAREELRYLLTRIGDVEIVGEAASGKEALALIGALDYDVVFLDINFPNSNGIEVGEKIKEMDAPPFIVYITAYEQYALKAFEVNAVDYILKPIEEEKLSKTIEKIKKLKVPAASKAVFEQTPVKLERISVEFNGRILLLDINEIFYAYSEGSYVFVRTFDNEYITKYTLNSLEERLDPKLFFRCHRSYLVNLSKIKEITPFFQGTYNIRLADSKNSEIPVSRRQAKGLKKLLEI